MRDFNPFTDRKYGDFALPYSNFWARWQFTANFAYVEIADVLYAYPVVYGIDLSHYNADPIDFKALYDGGWKFVIHRASMDTQGIDTQFAPRYPVILDNGLLLIAYGFSRGNLSGALQAEHLLRTIEPFLVRVNGNTILMDDTETADGASVSTVRSRVIAWHGTIRNNFNMNGSMEYSSPGLWQSLTNNMILPDGIWQDVAHWTSAENPMQIIGWPPAYKRLWQIGVYGTHSWCPRPPGWPVGKRVDIQVFPGTETELRAWIGNQVAPQPKTALVRVDTGDRVYEGNIQEV